MAMPSSYKINFTVWRQCKVIRLPGECMNYLDPDWLKNQWNFRSALCCWPDRVAWVMHILVPCPRILFQHNAITVEGPLVFTQNTFWVSMIGLDIVCKLHNKIHKIFFNVISKQVIAPDTVEPVAIWFILECLLQESTRRSGCFYPAFFMHPQEYSRLSYYLLVPL